MAKICIKNNSVDKNLIVYISGKTIFLKPDEAESFETDNTNLHIFAEYDIKTKIKVNFLSVWLSTALNTDAKCKINCVCEFDYLCTEGENRLDFCDKERRINNSNICLCFAETDASRNDIKNINYNYKKADKPILKHSLTQLVFLSALPFIIAGIIYEILDFKIGMLLAILILVFVGFIPSLKSIKAFNKICKDCDSNIKSYAQNENDTEELEDILTDIANDKETSGTTKFFAKLIKKIID